MTLEISGRPTEDALRTLLDFEELKQLKARYMRYRDLKKWDEWKELFTDDLRFESEHNPHSFTSSDALVEAVKSGMSLSDTVHMGHMPELWMTGPDSATGIWGIEYIINEMQDGRRVTRNGFGFYHEQYVRRDGRWLFASIRVLQYGSAKDLP